MQTTTREEHRGERDMRLHGRRLTLARVVWGGLATFELGMFVVSLPGFVAQLQIVCTSSCMNQQLSADAVRTLQHAGLMQDEVQTIWSCATNPGRLTDRKSTRLNSS